MGDTSFVSIRNYYERTVEIETAAGDAYALPLRIQRFTLEQLQRFSAGWSRCEHRAADRLIARKQDGDEQEKETVTFGRRSVEVFKVPDAEIRRRRILEMTPAELADFERMNADDEAFIAKFYAEAITEHLSVKPGVRVVFETEDGRETDIQTGADLVHAFAGNAEILATFAQVIRQENTLGPAEKKRLQSLSALSRSLRESSPTAAGDPPEPTAANAATEASASNAPVTDDPATHPSGLTGISSSTPALS